MGKDQVKSKILEALEKSPLKDSISKLSLFGSYSKGSAVNQSDIDLLVEFYPEAHVGFFKLSEIKDHIEKEVGKSVDLVTPDAISHYLKQNILKESELIYER